MLAGDGQTRHTMHCEAGQGPHMAIRRCCRPKFVLVRDGCGFWVETSAAMEPHEVPQSVCVQRVCLASRPAINEAISDSHFKITAEECTLSYEPLGGGDGSCSVLVRTLFLSCDPYMRCRFNEDSGVEYAPSFAIGSVIHSGGVGEVLCCSTCTPQCSERCRCAYPRGSVVASRADSFHWPWSNIVCFESASRGSPASEANALWSPSIPRCDIATIFSASSGVAGCSVSPSHYLGCLGMPGLTAYFGVLKRSNLKAGQTLFVTGAAGAVGHIAGQMAKRLVPNVRVVGACGTAEKVALLKDSLGFDEALNYKECIGEYKYHLHDHTHAVYSRAFERTSKAIAAACPGGVDAFFDNTGGVLADAVISSMNDGGHVILCGQIATYDTDVEYPPPLPPQVKEIVAGRNITRERYLVLTYLEEFEAGQRQLREWMDDGMQGLETVTSGLSNCPSALVSMMRGGNIGKQIVSL